MPLEKIYVVRHGFRSGWSVDPIAGTYSSLYPSPTGIPVDPALTAHGIEQANELAAHLMTLDPPIGAVYSSPYYRCLQTIRPFVELQQQQKQRSGSGGSVISEGDFVAKRAGTDIAAADAASDGSHVGVGVDDADADVAGRRGGGVKTTTRTEKTTPSTPTTTTPKFTTTIRPEYGLSEWFGSAPFEHPGPATPATLQSMFPSCWDSSYQTIQRSPRRRGETPAQLQRRVADTVRGIIQRCDAEGQRSVVLCTHAAVVIMLGRVLTGRIPESVDADDFGAFTCGLSVYGRRSDTVGTTAETSARTDRAVLGAWVCEANSDCSFLSGGAERGWRFAGDEDFPGTRSMSETPAHKL